MRWSLKLCFLVLFHPLHLSFEKQFSGGAKHFFLPLPCVPFDSLWDFFFQTLQSGSNYSLQASVGLWGSPSALSDIFTEGNGLPGPVSGWTHIQIAWMPHPWSYCSLKILIVFHGFHPTVVMTTSLQCQQTSYDLVIFRSSGGSVCEKRGYVSAD